MFFLQSTPVYSASYIGMQLFQQITAESLDFACESLAIPLKVTRMLLAFNICVTQI